MHAGAMSTDTPPEETHLLTYLAPAGGMWGHRNAPDLRTPEERAEAQAKENARRRGRGRGNWWENHLDGSGRLAT